MKKVIFALVMAVLICFIMYACGEEMTPAPVYTDEVSFELENESNTIEAPDESMKVVIKDLSAKQDEYNTYGELTEVDATVTAKVKLHSYYDSEVYKPYLGYREIDSKDHVIGEHIIEIRNSFFSSDDDNSFKFKTTISMEPETARVIFYYQFLGERDVEENYDWDF